MSDSLRDQLIAAGYKAPKEEKKKQSHHKKKKSRQSGKKTRAKRKPADSGCAAPAKKAAEKAAQIAQDQAAIDERKKLKAQIKALIDEKKLSDWKGETAYRYLVDSRIRELYVTDAVQTALAARELAITRLNGDTYVVPRETALSIRQINPQWSVFNLEAQPAETGPEESEEYSEYKVPDDLKW
ncbi:MAG: DUF2058 family protein [Pseudomonadota bacterium]